ncbi:ankyrin repeat domain-containing protein [Puia dinghuensis]|uniref:Ankyrin repeat domain-containing protein n=1 Tax=Puia dinghuensis TaxID=1792502 RepID=A0A8J2XTP8_9BACT|nr:ankyrin repeat domain-containing protein [Puia dinghuensis]GGB19383.1 hypothetical protein GCM10011511_48860 [Puia dinghuensis]
MSNLLDVSPLPEGMMRPPALDTQEYLPWSRGRGVEVWAMLVAAMNGDVETMKKLEAKDAGLLDCELEYFSPMHFAVRENRVDAVRYLLESGVVPVMDFEEPVWEAARMRGHEEMAVLLEEWVREHYHIRPEGGVIAAAIRDFDVDGVKDLIEEELVHAADKRGNQPIHWAVLTRQMGLIDYLLSRGADINARRPDGARPLDLTNGDYYYRSWYRDLPPTGLQQHEVLIGYLMARGAYCDISVAAKIGWHHRVKELLDADPGLANRLPDHVGYYSGLPLRNAAAEGHLEVVKLLLSRGANPNEPEPGIAPSGAALHSAVSGRHYVIVRLLLEHGANANAMVESSGDVLYTARRVKAPQEIIDLIAARATNRDKEIIAYEADAEVLARTLAADAAAPVEHYLGRLISEDLRPQLELILQYQQDIFRRQTMLSAAWWDKATFASAEQARWLLQRGLDPRLRNWLGITMLHRCAAKGLIDIAEVLLEFGADIDAVESEWSSTPLGWAVRLGQKEMAAWLLAQGADVGMPLDRPWARPIEWAKRKGDGEMMELFKEGDA